MSFLSAFDICGSGLTAQRKRLDIASENLANSETTRTESGNPYRRKMVVLEEIRGNQMSFRSHIARAAGLQNSRTNTGGVRVAAIVEDQRDLIPVYDPDHPDADEDGYVQMPNVDMVKETIDGMSATRSYEANITAFNAIKLMAQKALDIGK